MVLPRTAPGRWTTIIPSLAPQRFMGTACSQDNRILVAPIAALVRDALYSLPSPSPLALTLIFTFIFTLAIRPRSGILLPEGNFQAHKLQGWHFLPSGVSRRDAVPDRYV